MATKSLKEKPTNASYPEQKFWTTTGLGAVATTISLFALAGAFFDTGLGDPAEIVLGALAGLLTFSVFRYVSAGIAWLLRYFPKSFLVTIGGVIGSVVFLRETQFLRGFVSGLLDISIENFTLPTPLSTVSLLALVLAQSILTGLTIAVAKGKVPSFSVNYKRVLVGLAALCIGFDVFLIWSLAKEGSNPYQTNFKTFSGNLPPPLDIEDPSRPGHYDFEILTYGSGVNHRRPEFGEGADLKSRTVDGSKLLKDWKGSKKRMREWYWGFGLEKAPLNARVWVPVGEGAFPLVLIVHGNHTMEDYSDPGYAYLGELLASRGYITVSLDENYINGTWSGDFRGKEMQARAWLLLEHLRLWREWNKTPNHRFAGKVDMENIALIGHSRGGEAIAIAAAYNRLPFYPDDATLEFDYNFPIRSLVAIAQIDRRYTRRIELQNINFLALHGSYDSDESAYHGLRQFNRIQFTDDNYWFKAGVYLHGANHGQFNTTWGRQDSRPPRAWLLNLRPIIFAEDQQQMAKVYISAFLETTLRKTQKYLPLFRDARLGSDWLPNQIYVTQFEDSGFEAIATFEEDLNVTTGTAPGTTLSAEGLTLWREEELQHRDKLKQGTSAVVLGWNHTDEDSTASFTIDLPKDLGSLLDKESFLSFWVSGSTEKSPKAEQGGDPDSKADDDDKEKQEQTSPKFSLEVVDIRGQAAQINSDYIASIAPPLFVQLLKSKTLSRKRYQGTWEPILQTCEVHLGRFKTANPDIDISQIRQIRFRFDNPRGIIILDNIGIRTARRKNSQ